MKMSFERTRTGILAIAAAGIFAAGAVAERANQLYATAASTEPASSGESAVTAGRPAERQSSESDRL